MRIRSLALTLGFVALVGVGCSSTDSTDTATNGGTTPPTTAGTSSTTAKTTGTSGTSMAPAAGATKIAVSTSPLGEILVDGQGMTLYVFMKDTATTSACTEGCAQAWPAVTGEAVEPGTGLDADDFTMISGAGGTSQIVFYGHPLYTYAGDNAPGDTTGQGVGGFWYVVGTDGTPVQTAP